MNRGAALGRMYSAGRARRSVTLMLASWPLGATLHAQPPPPDAPAIEEMVVTAQKRAENLQDVAVAVSAFDGDSLAAAGVTDAMQLQTVVPSLTYNATGDIGQPYLRGVGTRLSPIGLEPSIGTYIDGRYVSRPIGAMFDLLDVERVEVLKGPQGALYGRNAVAGAIRVVTKDPTDELTVAIDGQTGSYDASRLSLAVGGPLTPRLRGQLAAGVEQRDGLATNLVPTGRAAADDVDRALYRGKLLWDIGEGASAKLSVSAWRRQGWVARDFVAAGVPQANRGGALYGGITSRDRDHFASALSWDTDLRETSVDLRFDVPMGDIDFVSITTYADASYFQVSDLDVSSIALLDTDALETADTWSQEFHWASAADGKLEWLAGLSYYRQAASNVYMFRDSVTLQPAYPVGTDLTNGLQTADTEAYALFGQVAYDLDETWSFRVGTRWSHERKRATLESVPDAIINAPAPYARADKWDEVTPQIAIEFRRAFGLAYLSYSRGFKSGGFNYPASLNPVLQPERLASYELGVKTDLWQRRLRLSSALFHYDFEDLQVTRGGAGAFTITENAADSRIVGLEVDFAIAVGAALTLSGGVALIDGEYRNYTAAALVPQDAPPHGSVALADGIDVTGRPLLRSPETAAYVGLRYAPTLQSGAQLPLDINYAYKGDYYFDFSAVPETEWLEQRAHAVLNARIAYAARGGRWELGVWGTNLTDEVYYEDAVVNSFSSRVSYADPRMYGIDFKLRL